MFCVFGLRQYDLLERLSIRTALVVRHPRKISTEIVARFVICGLMHVCRLLLFSVASVLTE